MTSWMYEELVGCEFADVRLGKRFRALVNSCNKQSEKRFRWRAKIGQTRKRLTDSFPTTVSMSKRVYPGIFKQHGIVSTR
jgi:hypothetical protein